MADTRKSYSFIGNDCPPGYRLVGTIDVADPADVHSAQDKGYRIGTIYDGYSGSCAEPCAADIYERPLFEIRDKTGEEPCGECHIQPGETCDICGASNPAPQTKLRGLVERLTSSLAAFTKHYDPSWMETPRWATEDDSNCSTFSKHTFGELRQAAKLVEEARAALATEPTE